MVESTYFKKTILPQMKKVMPIDAGKVEAEIKLAQGLPGGEHRPMPHNGFARGIVEELHKHPLVVSPIQNWGIWDKPVVLCHNARGGVEYQEEMVKYFGSVSLDLNSPNSWDNFTERANRAGLKWTWWRHVHNRSEIVSLLLQFSNSPQKTGGLNLEDVVSEGISIPQTAADIDRVLGNKSILYIPTMGWIQNQDWSALSRHVFGLEFFLNDPARDWVGLDDVDLARQLAFHARQYGVKKLNFICGIYDASATNPNARNVTAAHYKWVLKQAGETFGGIYLGDNNGPNYSQWA